MPDLQTILADPDFRAASAETQREILRAHDADFAASSKATQDAILASLRPAQSVPIPFPGELAQEVLETVAPPAGAIVGGLVGLGATRTPYGAVLGAGLGGAAGQQLTEVTRPFLTGAPSRPVESLQRVGMTGLLSAVGEAAGGAMAKLAQRFLALAPFRKSVTGAAVQREVERVGATLTAGQQTESRLLDVLENITEPSLLGGGALHRLKRQQVDEAIPALTREVLTGLGPGGQMPPGMVATLLAQSRQAALAVHKQARRILYDEVDRLAQTVTVPTQGIQSFLRQQEGRRAVQRALSAADVGPDMFVIQHGAFTQNAVPFSVAQEARSRLLAVARRKALTVDDQAVVNVAGKLASVIDDAMETAAQRLNPQALLAFRGANQFTREGMDRLENELIRQLARRLDKEPTKALASLTQPNQVDLLKKVRAATDAPTFERLQERLTTSVVERAIDPQTGILQGKRLLEIIKGLGEETRPLVLKHPDAVERLGATAAFAQTRAGEATGRVFIQLTQAGAAAAAFSLNFKLEGVAILLGPAALARVLGTRGGITWLTQGLAAGPRTPLFFRAMSQVAAAAVSPEELRRPVRLSEESRRRLQEAEAPR